VNHCFLLRVSNFLYWFIDVFIFFRPDIELQKPLHKVERDESREKLRKAMEEEKAKNQTVITKIKELYNTMRSF